MASDHASLDRFNRSLDAAFAGQPIVPDDEDTGLAWTIRRLRMLDDGFALTLAAKDQMWRAAMSHQSIAQPVRRDDSHGWTNALTGREPTIRRDQPVRPTVRARRWWPGAELASAAILVLALLTAYAAYRLALPSSQAGVPNWQTPQSGALYVSDPETQDPDMQFFPVDPATLIDLEDQSAIRFGVLETISADGSTTVS
ncbi:MAG: hypothetical protein ACRDJH_03550, partial [Thermomicrobiales bacterium]